MTDLPEAQKATNISLDGNSQRVTFKFEEAIPTANAAVLEIDYEGTINNDMAGFYRSKYRPAVTPVPSVPKEGDDYFMFSTQFEACDARRAFPCFDEPNLKATFEFSIEIPKDQVALSNMPEKEIMEGRNGRKIVSFARTPVMSTYVNLAPFIKNFLSFFSGSYKHYKCRVTSVLAIFPAPFLGLHVESFDTNEF